MSWSWLFDDFNRTASSTSVGTAPTGQTWVNSYGTLGIDGSGRLYCPASSGGGRDYIETGVSDFTLTITLVNRDASCEAWVHFRTSSPGNNFWRFGAAGGGNYVLHKYNNPTLTAYTTSTTPASGDVIEIDCSGSSIDVKVNGSSIVSTTDSYNATATQVGIELYSASTNGNTFDDLDIPASVSAAADFGLYIPSNVELDAYYNDALKDRFTVPDAHATGSDLAIAAFYDPATLGGPSNMLISLDKIDVYDGPGGSLLLSDDFTSLAGWSTGHNGSSWGAYPASHASIVVPPSAVFDTSATLYRPMPGGAKYLVMRGVRYSAGGGDDSWLMGLLNVAGSATLSPFDAGPFYRLFMERPGSGDNTRADMARGTAAQPVVAPDETAHLGRGWVVGALAMN